MILKTTHGRSVAGTLSYLRDEKSVPQVLWHMNGPIPHVHIEVDGKTVTQRIGGLKQ